MIIEEVTLAALARAIYDSPSAAARETLVQAQRAREVRLRELRMAVSQVAAIGEFYRLRRWSAVAAWGGSICGVLGAIAIVLAIIP